MIEKLKRVGYSPKRLLYTLCFLTFCVIDQRVKTGSGLNGVNESFRDLTGIVMGVILLSHYKWKDFRKWKIPYIAWSVAGLGVGAGLFALSGNWIPFWNDRIVVCADVFLWGYIVIHVAVDFFAEKRRPGLDGGPALVWLAMMLAMIWSRNTSLWPLCYLVVFGCFYLTAFTEEERRDLWRGCVDGVVLSFILFQGFCCVFRPYDAVRYVGIHNNSNLNALYYLAVLGAVFTRILELTKNGAAKWIRIVWWLMAGAALSFLFMTIGRIAWITAFVMGLIFLGLWNGVTRRRKWIRNGMLLALCFLLMFPVCFGATRYLPPVFHHPVWFWGEWSDEKVHSWDEWDSDKYVDLDEFLEAAVGRIAGSVENLLEHSPLHVRARAAAAKTGDFRTAADRGDSGSVADAGDLGTVAQEEDSRIAAAILQPEQETDTLLVRGIIYKHYLTHLNWRGHPYEEQGFQLTRYYWIGHAHNIYLQYGTDFGIPVMILFTAMILWGIIRCGIRGRRNGSAEDVAALFFIAIPAVFGLLECAWGVGSLSITMLFIAWGQAIQEKKEDVAWNS